MFQSNFFNFIKLIQNGDIDEVNDLKSNLFLQRIYYGNDDMLSYYIHLGMIIKKIKFSDFFNNNIDNIIFPENIIEIDMGVLFNQSIGNDKQSFLPIKTKILKLGDYFNQSIETINKLENLEILYLGKRFNQPIENINFPENIKIIYFGSCFKQPLNIKINNTTELYFTRISKETSLNLPNNLEKLSIDTLDIELTNLPINLKILKINYDLDSYIQKSKIPFNVKIIFEQNII